MAVYPWMKWIPIFWKNRIFFQLQKLTITTLWLIDKTFLMMQWKMCYSRKKSNRASWRYTFLKSPLEYLHLSLYPCKFKTKKAFTTGNSAKLCDTPGNSKVENQDLWKIYMNFSPSSLETTSFSWPLEFPHGPSSNIPGMSSPVSVWIFSAIS